MAFETNNLIVTSDWLANHLNEEQIRIVDIRGHVLPASEPPPHYFSHQMDYLESHIPNAVFVDWTQDIVDPDSPSYDVIAEEEFSALMEQLGIANDHFVVAYDDAGGMFAARLWWVLKYYGHEKVAILDGGWQEWLAENRPTTADVPFFPQTEFQVSIQAHVHKSSEEVLQALSSKTKLLDVRSAVEFNGESSRANRKGHIPSSLNLPRSKMLIDDKHMLSIDDLKSMFQKIGLSKDDEVIVYCNSGVSASFGMIALRLAGYGRVSVYDGSWKDWGNDETKPIV